MRHRLGTRWVIAVAAAAMLSLGAGCGQDAGVDGDLLNDWTAMAPATGFEPKAGTCHLSNFAVSGPRSTYEEVDCKLRHRTETVHVGAYPSPAADAAEPPGEGSAGARTAYRTCDAKTTEYVGGEWRTARLWIGVTHPSPSAWTGGARWYRCELVEIDSIEDDGALVERVSSLPRALGDHGVRCYLWLDGATLTTSLKGKGTKGMPVQYK